ncbi:hypothetical protein LWI28_028246 [Acer negundo]|uniref:Dof zinc finger protein n=1 Tax=Acer negundo TaxID=4023 RepID=A0AAD5IB52_ACENE|nr:hypothetical protein LWI28_028246 [Acer negundo]KAK4836141.1 hypothetical protein QYF36_019082 [Acer negundo]
MNFSSVPLYLDPPNWQQQQNQQQGGISSEIASQQLPPRPPLLSGGGGSIRPGSMAERARILGKIPQQQPESALKCPRCESTNTKFCYFNNYSLSQPRHFCKTCRRYWTRGGALRSVPVGGGCRRNKRSKPNNNSTTSARPKSPVVNNNSQLVATTSTTTNNIFHAPPPPQPQVPILPPLHHLSDINSGGLGFGGIQAPDQVAAGGSLLSSGIVEQWRSLQQFPFMSGGGGLESTTGLFSLESDDGGGNYVGQLRSSSSSKPLLDNSSGDVNQFAASVKMEDHNNSNQGLNLLSRNFLGISGNDHHQYWGTNNNNAWTDHNIHGFNSSSTSHLL